MKYVSDSAAAKCLRAYVILNPAGKLVGMVRAHHSEFTCTVNVFNHGKGSEGENGVCFQRSAASGYGYDKFTSAIRGLVIDGIELHDHCATDVHTSALLTLYNQNATGDYKTDSEWCKVRGGWIGASFANWDREAKRYTSCYYVGGLKRLELLGYTVIQAL